MISLVPWAVVAMASLTQARFGRLPLINDTMECCPCPTGGLGRNGTTVTVTATQPKETVTVEWTVTVTEHDTTVFVTQTPPPCPPNVVIEEVTVQPQPVEKFVTGLDQNSNGPEQGPPKTITKTIQLGGGEPQGPKTVTVNIIPAQGTTITVTNGGAPSQPSEIPGAVTVTFNPQPSAGPPRPNGDQGVVTETVFAGAQPSEVHTVFVNARPGVKTVTFVNNEPSTEVKTVQQATVTSAPQIETVVKSIDQYTTLTKTVSSGGPNNIEITIINIFTGETIFMKQNGEPCDSEPQRSSATTPCPTGILTSTATAFNTVIVTMSQGMGFNSTTQRPSVAGNSMASQQRVPMIRKNL